jgi:hypothetical protein
MHKYAEMRTTLDIPDDLYRSLKARAALNGVPMREIVTQLIHLGLRSVPSAAPTRDRRHAPPPIAIPPRGVPIAALSHEDKLRAEEIEDEAKHAGSA